MPGFVKLFIRGVDGFNRRIGRFMMYGIFAMMAILLWSSFSKTFLTPSLWTLEMAQFAMVAYYILGGPYSMQMGSNVRMDLFYGEWTLRQRAIVDAITVFLLMFYIAILIHGAVGSSAYALGHFGVEPYGFYWELIAAFVTGGREAASEVIGYIERSPTAWRPVLWPIKIIMLFGFILMFLQSVSELLKDIARIRGVDY
ncbi:TRAP transporter small permease subunit [Shimia marina]|uniref:TRAP transporter small permease protein n=1 Tax=Shimia marina TaxID=321267 RepID=A0A0P1ERN5_9RHOB|nr:TRAP transporter small permease subunit [Shimia marina]CUH53177.1 TRAP-type mannitol/chloroaromatic compound transport system, small permease component [Shimia marina]SFD82993.1 TRAP-type mannitol/chloroaromatic compound transport system, small permease component [Shimia marina]